MQPDFIKQTDQCAELKSPETDPETHKGLVYA